MLQLLGIAVVIWIVWKLIRAAAGTATRQAYYQGAAESLSLPSAEAQHHEAELAFIGTAGDQANLSNAELQGLLERAVFLKDRVNQLSGQASGPASRAAYRNELISRVNRIRSAHFGTPEEHKYTSFEEWLDDFKEAAGDANSTLADKENGSLIDFMDHTPLHRAFADGIDPYDLGAKFGESFDFADFMSRHSHMREPN